MGSCAAPSAKGDDKFITTDYLQQCQIIGWSMQSRMTKDIVLNAQLMAVWRRNPQKQVLVHSDQGSQYTSHEWQSFLKSH
ncbi:DDE-type integrase/transposase/recombinase, partial [Escherichia coli]